MVKHKLQDKQTLQNRSGLASQQAALAQSQLGLGQAKSGLAAQQAALAQVNWVLVLRNKD